MDEVSILGVKINKVNIKQAVDIVERWLKSNGKHYITTPNIEFIMLAQKDDDFRYILNNSDMAIPDSARLSWAYEEICEKNLLKKILKWPLFVFPYFFKKIPTTTGVDLMDKLCRSSNENGFTVGLLGGQEGIAEKASECLRKKYPNLKISFAFSGGRVNENGDMDIKIKIPNSDIIFVGFGQLKQEKWIAKHLKVVDAKVFIGVGGSFDYLSGKVHRAPKILRALGFEWLFRLFMQPWRLKRFSSLVKFVFLVLTI